MLHVAQMLRIHVVEHGPRLEGGALAVVPHEEALASRDRLVPKERRGRSEVDEVHFRAGRVGERLLEDGEITRAERGIEDHADIGVAPGARGAGRARAEEIRQPNPLHGREPIEETYSVHRAKVSTRREASRAAPVLPTLDPRSGGPVLSPSPGGPSDHARTGATPKRRCGARRPALRLVAGEALRAELRDHRHARRGVQVHGRLEGAGREGGARGE